MSKIPNKCEAFIITKSENDIKCYALQSLEMSLSMSADVYAEFIASGQYIDNVCTLDFITKSIAYANELSKHKNLTNAIKNKRKELANLDAAVLRERTKLTYLKEQEAKVIKCKK